MKSKSVISDTPKKQNVRVIPKDFIIPFILVTSLFFLWAIAHNMNDILIRQFQKAMSLSRGQASFIQVSFYFAYAFVALPAGYAMKMLGYKKAILIGLMLYAFGAVLFYPAAELGSYGMFLVALFIIASGIVFLETSGSGYITLVGDPSTAARRINFSQSFNGLGAIAAPVLGGVFIFSGIEYSNEQLELLSPQALQSYHLMEARQVQMPYLSIAGILVFIAFLVSMTKFPPSMRSNLKATGFSFAGMFQHSSFVWALIAQFFYVGAQIGTWSYFIDFTKELTPLTPEKTAAYFLSVSLFGFMIGRFVGTYLMKYVSPRLLLGVYALINVGMMCLALSLTGTSAVIALGASSFFMSIMFPTIYALGLEDLGEQAELGSSLIIMTIISGAIIPPIMGYVSDVFTVQWAYVVPLLCFLVVWLSTRFGHSEPNATI